MREKLQKPMLKFKFASPNPQKDKTRLIYHIKKCKKNFNVTNTHTAMDGPDRENLFTVR